MAETSQEAVNKFFAVWFRLNLDEVPAANGDVVFNESVDITDVGGGKRMEPPVVGVFKMNGHKIATCRDYCDIGMGKRGPAQGLASNR